jgi:hypothetical protein
MATVQQPLSPEVVHHIPLKSPVSENGESVSQNLAIVSPVELLRIAVSQNANVDQLTKLMDLQERWERREAKRAYDAAMKAFKAAAPQITKNHQVGFEAKDPSKGRTDYKHATLDHVCDALVGALAQHGIYHSWKVTQESQWIHVTCILTHELGHSEETTLMGAPDNTGNKNAIQAVGSTVTYLQRYTLLAACGLATSNSDNDGRGATLEAGISEKRRNECCEWISNAANEIELRQYYFEAVREARAAKDRSAEAAYIAAKDVRKRELR